MRRLIACCSLLATPFAMAHQLTESFKLIAPDGAGDDRFGASVDMDDQYIVIGATHSDAVHQNEQYGAAYVFSADDGSFVTKLTAFDRDQSDLFGSSIAVNDGLVAVGSPLDGDFNADSGSVYLFEASTGAFLFKLTANDPGGTDNFGHSVDLDAGVLAVGAPGHDHDGNINSGAVYLFDATSGTQLAELLPASLADRPRFGTSVAMKGGLLVVGAPAYRINQVQTGAAFIFDVETGQQLHRLIADDRMGSDEFGQSVAINEGLVAVGAPDANNHAPETGAAYVFDAATGQQLCEVDLGFVGHKDDYIGCSLAISGGVVAVGARGMEIPGEPRAGRAFLFEATTGEFLTAADPVEDEGDRWFGNSLAACNGKFLVGAFQEDNENGLSAGAAYLFTYPPRGCLGDLADDFGSLGSDGMVSFGDFLALLGLVGPCPGGKPGCTGDIADDFGTLGDGDGQVSFGDFLALLGLVGPCP